MHILSNYLKYRPKLINPQLAFNPHLFTVDTIKDMNNIIKEFYGSDLKTIMEDIDHYQYKKLMNQHFSNLQKVSALKNKGFLNNVEQNFIESLGPDNSNLKSSCIYLPSGRIIKSSDKDYIRALIEEPRFLSANVRPFHIEMHFKNNNNSAKIITKNPIENRNKNPRIITSHTAGDVTITNTKTFDNYYYDVFKANPENAKPEDFITVDRSVSGLEKTDELERE